MYITHHAIRTSLGRFQLFSSYEWDPAEDRKTNKQTNSYKIDYETQTRTQPYSL